MGCRFGRAPARLEVALGLSLALFGCGADEVGETPPTDELQFPIGLAAHPDGRYLYLSNAVLDRRYAQGTVVVYDTWDRRLLSKATVPIGLFAGDLVVGRERAPADCAADSDEARCHPEVYAYTVTRDDGRLLRFQVNADAGDSPEHLTCDRAGLSGTCQSPSVIDTLGTGAALPSDPYGLALSSHGLLVSHVGQGAISHWHVGGEQQGYPAFGCARNLTDGASSVAWHPVAGRGYVTDRFGQRISVLEPVALPDRGLTGLLRASDCALTERSAILVDPFTDRGHTRGLAFSADGGLLYAANSSDGSLRIYDTTLGADGEPKNAWLASLPVGTGPNVVRVAGLRSGERRADQQMDLGTAGQVVDEKGQGLVYVTLYNDDRLAVIDPQLRAVIARVEVGAGPHDIAFMPDSTGHLFGYVTNFQDNTLTVLDLEPGSARRFTVVATVP